ncbi:MAG: hypothetical protein O6761_01890 [Thaumarchaeota archaeon]|nr:MAG: hypothetical protein NPMRIOTA_300013 [Nitrosopumilales archaeon]MCZ6581906.1 hypothetical protein [Nitrososphaerota archaeon]GFN39949.1 MAG: conserved hypothetical protein [Marine Group I thaumarchaeote]
MKIPRQIKMLLSIKIKYLNIYESYFKGKVEYEDNEFTINIQDERRGKVTRFPFPAPKKDKVLVRLSGPNNVSIEDILVYKGESEWVELDSNPITFYIADHQDQFDLLEIIMP